MIFFYLRRKKKRIPAVFKTMDTLITEFLIAYMYLWKFKKNIMFLYLFSTIAVLKHMSLKENKVQFRKKNTSV